MSGGPEPRAAVVDDDGLTRGLVTTILGTRGWRSRAFGDATSALAELEASPFDVVICDLHLPDVGGDRLCASLRRRLGRAAPPVVMISGADEEEDVGRALDAGAWHYVRKPFTPGALMAIVERARRQAPPPDDARVPRLGPYCLLGELGRGGMGVVYRAVDDDGHEVALKVLPPLSATVEDRLRFRRELDVLAGLAHPGVARLLECGADQGRTWFAMELVPGETLHAAAGRGPLGWARAARLGRDLAATLAYVHGRGLVHRDVKPQNVIVRPDGRPVLIDFGLARRPRDLALTSPSVIMGTPMYMAPELANGAPSPASDVFGLGLTLREALTGAPPLGDPRYALDPLLALGAYARRELPPLGGDVPPALALLERVMTDPDPARRPTAIDVAARLATLGDPS